MSELTIDNRYRTLQALGEGAMGMVWLAEDGLVERQVALKVVSTRLGDSDKSRLQFKQEFRLMTQLRHPNCCQVFDYGETSDGEPYFTMEVVFGHGLDELIEPTRTQADEAGGVRQKGLDEATFRKVFAQLMLALGYVHGLGLVHADLKPANVRVRPDGMVKLMDYGLMDYAGRTGGPIRGTPAYMAPEVIKRGAVDRRSDLYSAGCLAYEMLTGQLPFGGTQETVTAVQLLRQHVAEKPMAPHKHKPELSDDISAMVIKLLAKDPLERYQSAFEVLEALGAEVPVGIGGALLGSPLIGRAQEMGKLFMHMARVVTGKPGGGLLVTGPSGIGKSRLLAEFRFAAQLEGLPCPGGECFEQENPPYGPFLAVLKALAPTFRDLLPPELFAIHAPVLVKLLPSLGAAGGHPEVVPVPDLESPKNEMMRMFTAISHVLCALARVRPYVMTLENWQWADPLSADLLDYLLRNLAGAPLLVVVTSRHTVDAARAIMSCPRVDLLGLAGPDLRRMVISMLGTQDCQETFLAKISEFSEGNPFMIERLLEHLVQTLVLVNTRGHWNTETALDDYVLPLGLHAVLMRKLTALSPSAQVIANLCAVIGRQFDMALIAESADLPDDEFLEALDELQQAQLLLQGEGGMLSFVQDQVPELIYTHLGDEEKVWFHGEIARALEARLEVTLADAALEQVVALARHALAGQLPIERTLRYALEAGERNRRLHAMSEAERFIGAALALVEDAHGALHQFLKLGLLSTMGDIKRQTGRAAEGRPLLEQALLLSQELDAKPVGRLLVALGKTQQMLNDLDGALETLANAVETCREEDDPTGASRATLASARVHLFKGAPQRALAYAEEGLKLAHTSGDATQLGLAHALIGYLAVASAPERLEEGVEHLQESLALLEESGDQIGLSTSYQLLGNSQLVLGDYEPARDSFGQNRRIAIQINNREEEAFACINLGIVALELADFAGALAWAREAREKVERLNARFPLGIAMVVEAEALGYLGQEAAARELAVQSLAIAREIRNTYLEGLVLGHQCELLAFLGRSEEARQAASALTTMIGAAGPEREARLNAVVAELRLRAGDSEGARMAAESSYEIARQTQAKGIEVRAAKTHARLAMLKLDYSAAQAKAVEAIALARRIGMRGQAVELLGIAGEAGLAMGDGTASGHFDTMLAIATEIDSPPLIAQALFGLAASRPYEGGAAKAAEAKARFAEWLEPMTPEGRAAFPSFLERRRVLDGNYIGFSLPLRPRQPSGRDTRPLRLGMMGTGDMG